MRVLTSRSWLAWLAIVVGVLWAIPNALDINTIAGTRHWATAPGTIIALRLSSDTIGEYGRVRAHAIRANRLHLAYAYQVGAQTYTGSQWNALGAANWPATHAMLRQYSPGSGVVVHYDAHDPSSAVLDTSWPIAKYVQLVFALLIAVVVFLATRGHRVTE